jgi:hypothetical protein
VAGGIYVTRSTLSMLSSLMVLSSAICAAVNISTASVVFFPEKSGGELSAAVANRAIW